MKFKKINPNIIMILVIAILVIGGFIGVSAIKGNNNNKNQGAVAQNVESITESPSDTENNAGTESQEMSSEETSQKDTSEESSATESGEETSEEASGEKNKGTSASSKKETSAVTKKETTATKKETTASKKETTAAKKETTASKKETTAAKKETTAAKKETTAAAKKETTAAPTTAAKKTCTITIRCDTILNNMDNLTPGKESLVPSSGCILSKKTVEFDDGETVFDVLKRVCSNAGIQLEYAYTPAYNSYYIEGINNLYEFDCGSESGWMYKVNGWFPNYGCSSYTLKNGDAIVWCYTCNGLGADVGAN